MIPGCAPSKLFQSKCPAFLQQHDSNWLEGGLQLSVQTSALKTGLVALAPACVQDKHCRGLPRNILLLTEGICSNMPGSLQSLRAVR